VKTCVFSGPTLSAHDVKQRLPEATSAGPAGVGDVLRAVHEGFERLAIVDGFFDQRQPAWHKEILHALERGIAVFGAASMGALRAVELEPFGMQGVGKIFELFRDGWLERDDEVAIAHGTPDENYRPLSDALVNARVTFRFAARDGVVSAAFAERCTRTAEAMFYAERSYDAVLAELERSQAAPEARALRAWLERDPSHRVDQKRIDALALLNVLAAAPAPAVRRPPFRMARTDGWLALVSALGHHDP